MDVSAIPTKISELNEKVIRCGDEDETAGWQPVKRLEKENLVIYSRPSTEFNGRMFKGEGIIEASPETCFKHCYPTPESTRASWDSTIRALEIVQKIQPQWPEVYILRTMTNSAVMGMISGRDFVDLIININTDKVMGTMAESTTTELCPPTKEYVRGHNHYCGILNFRIPGEPNKSRLVYLVQSDIGGRLPVSLVESAVPSAISNFYSALKKQIKK